jgi:CubicO group peptidase (beta-lactamase class C family)
MISLAVLSSLGLAVVATPTNEELAQHLQEALEAQVAESGFQGAVLVARGEEVLVRAGFGSADHERDLPNTPKTRFRIGSISKQFTAAAILLLVEAGEVRLDDLAGEYWIDTPAAWSEVSVDHLLHHTSGIFNVTDLRDFDAWQALPARPTDQMKKVAELPLNFEPGTSWKYSNTGYLFLAQIVEQASGRRLETFLDELLLDPLGIVKTGSYCLDAQVAGLAQGF